MTSIVGGNHPVWNEILTFDITSGRDELRLTVEDRQSGEVLGTASVSLGFFTEDEKSIDQLAKDMKVKLEGGAEGAELRLKVHWIYSKVNLLEDLLEELRRAIRQTQIQLNMTRQQLKAKKDPFMTLFLFVEQGKIMEKMTVEEQQLFFNKIDLEETVKIKEAENNFSRRIDDALTEQGY